MVEVTNINEDNTVDKDNNIIDRQVDNMLNNNLTEEEKEANREIYKQAMDKLNSYQLQWTFRSVKYVLDTENISFGQLRSCVYTVNGQQQFDYFKSIEILIKSGLIGSKQIDQKDKDKLNDKVNEIIDNWLELFSPPTLHLLIIHVMETKHFFTGMQDIKIVNYLNSINSQKDLGENLLKKELVERMAQAAALNNTI